MPQVPPWWLHSTRCCRSTRPAPSSTSRPAAPKSPQAFVPSGPTAQASPGSRGPGGGPGGVASGTRQPWHTALVYGLSRDTGCRIRRLRSHPSNLLEFVLAKGSSMHTAAPSPAWAHRTADLLEAVRARGPLVHCITNTVVQNVTANVLLALGASAAMVDVVTEAGPFARVADALLVNTGTPHAEPRDASVEAATAAVEAGTPWVLDPVAVGSLPVRTALAHELLASPDRPARERVRGPGGARRQRRRSRGRQHGRPDDARAAATAAAGRRVAAVAVWVRRPAGRPGHRDGPGRERHRAAHPGSRAAGCALGAVVAAFTSVTSTPGPRGRRHGRAHHRGRARGAGRRWAGHVPAAVPRPVGVAVPRGRRPSTARITVEQAVAA